MDDDIKAMLDAEIERTVGGLRAMSAQGITSHQALSMLMSAHMAHINANNMLNTAAGYAAALYQLTIYRVRIAELEDRVAMLQQLDEIREL